MRDLWQTTNINYGAKWGLATHPKNLKSSGIKRLIERALWEQGIRTPLVSGSRRHEWKAAHGFRKFYKTRTEQVMRPINVEITMGHNIGISASYYKPTEQEVLEDYLRAVDLLTIHGNEQKLMKQVAELQGKNKNTEYIINGKLEEKEEQIKSMVNKYDSEIQILKDAILDMQELLKNPSRLDDLEITREKPTKKFIELNKLTGEFEFVENIGSNSHSIYVPIVGLTRSTLRFPTEINSTNSQL